MLLSTHYRRPIEFTDEVLAATKKATAVFSRLFERVERLSGQSLNDGIADMDRTAAELLEGEMGPFVREVLAYKMQFLEMMDDDFNTAGAIAVLHELAGATNSFIEQQQIETKKAPDALRAVTSAAKSLKGLGVILGLFRQAPQSAAPKQETGLTEQLMQLFIQMRQDARRDKNFALADNIRDRLLKIGVTLEDRTDGTVWRKE
jgi:cysteinyl-tRNA synthetase